MKKNKNFKLGFTMMEMLITMLITALIAAAMVPVIGLKKIKVPVNRYIKGIAECYYEPVPPFDENGDPADWQLMYYYADNKDRRNATPVAVPKGINYCTFEAPNASFFEITAIGPGTDSYYEEPPTFGISPGEPYTTSNPYLRVDSHYQNSINSATVTNRDGEQKSLARAIRQVLNEWASVEPGNLFARYNVDSPVGAGGGGHCYPLLLETIDNRPRCRCDLEGGCPGPVSGTFYEINIPQLRSGGYGNQCYAYINESGTPSGEGMRTSEPLEFPLNGNTRISTPASYESAGVKVNGSGVTLYAAGAGNTPVCNFESKSCFGAVGSGSNARCEGNLCSRVMRDAAMANRPATTGQGNGPLISCSVQPGDPAKPGVVYFGARGDTNYNKIKWTYDAVAALVQQGSKGAEGEENTVVYENLKGRIYLMPSPYSGDNTDGITLVREDPNDETTTLVQAKSGRIIGEKKTLDFDLLASDIPFPSKSYEEAIPKNDFSYLSKLSAAMYRNGLRNCDPNGAQPWCPGFGGKGQYFFFDNLPDVNSLTIENLYKDGASYTVPARRLGIEREIDINREFCKNDITPWISLSPQTITSPKGVSAEFTPKYCREPGAKGRPGAVIIMW